MNKKLMITILTGAAGITIYLIRRSVVRKRSNQKKIEKPGSSLRSTPYPYEYSL